jgi:hypothetical protein
LSLFLLFLGRSFPQLNLNDIGRNCLLGNRKKIAKFLMRTFTCRSTFLYVVHCTYRIAGGFGNNFYCIVTGGYLKAGTRFLKRRLLEGLVSDFL